MSAIGVPVVPLVAAHRLLARPFLSKFLAGNACQIV
jgi:hypothetical protein